MPPCCVSFDISPSLHCSSPIALISLTSLLSPSPSPPPPPRAHAPTNKPSARAVFRGRKICTLMPAQKKTFCEHRTHKANWLAASPGGARPEIWLYQVSKTQKTTHAHADPPFNLSLRNVMRYVHPEPENRTSEKQQIASRRTPRMRLE